MPESGERNNRAAAPMARARADGSGPSRGGGRSRPCRGRKLFPIGAEGKFCFMWDGKNSKICQGKEPERGGTAADDDGWADGKIVFLRPRGDRGTGRDGPMMALPGATGSSVYAVHFGPSRLTQGGDERALARFRDQLKGERVRRLFAHWLELCPDVGVPRRADISPRALKDLLPYLVMWDYVPGKRTARIRLAGTQVVDLLPFEPTGRETAQMLPPEWISLFRAHVPQFYGEQRPMCYHLSMSPVGRPHVAIELLMLPLRRDGELATMGLATFDRLEI